MDVSSVKKGTKLMIDNVPYNVEDAEFMKPGKGSAIYRFKLKNIIDGSNINRTYHSGDKLEAANVTASEGQFLYRDGNQFIFMSTETYEQYNIEEETVGERKHFLKEGMVVTTIMLKDKPLDINLPTFVEFVVTRSDITMKTDTVTAQMKSATLENGYEMDVPAFIKEGDTIKIDTRTGSYVERVATGK